MIGEAALKTAAERVLQLARDHAKRGEGHGNPHQPDQQQAEVVLIGNDSSLTRFANNEIHQHVAERDVTVHVRVAIGKQVGSASGNGLDDDTLRSVVERAGVVARLQRQNPDFPGLPGPFLIPSPGQADPTATSTTDEGKRPDSKEAPPRVSRSTANSGGAPGTTASAQSTLDATPEARVTRAGIVCRRAQEAGFVAAGACSTSALETVVANSLGTLGYHAGTHARLLAVVGGATSSGYSVRQGADFASLDAEAVAEEATSKAEGGRDPDDIEPGEYDVVLEPYAAEDLIRFIAALGLQGRALLEKTSFAAEQLGQRVLSEHVTLHDDPLDPTGLVQPFDYEGVPKRSLTLVNQGVVQAVTYDSLTAAKAGMQTTGHALLGAGSSGPVATNLRLQPGRFSRDELIRKIERGLLVTRFWYTRSVHPLSVTVTGMTRDSTFLIERGEITRPVKNLRFTQSYVKALQQVLGVGAEPLLVGDSYGSPIRTPALAIQGFTFTGKSEY